MQQLQQTLTVAVGNLQIATICWTGRAKCKLALANPTQSKIEILSGTEAVIYTGVKMDDT